MAMPFALNHTGRWVALIKDDFLMASLSLSVGWPWWIAGAGFFILSVSIRNFLFRKKGNMMASSALKALNNSLLMITMFVVILPRLEQYTQGPAVNFCKEKAGKEAYVAAYGYKSYATYFYFNYPQNHSSKYANAAYLLNNKVDKPVYLITKVTDADLPNNRKVKLIKQQGGYRFYEKVEP